MSSSVPMPGHPVRGSKTGRPVMALFDLLGRAWAMGVIWQLNTGPHTFRSLRAACDDISPSLLNRRLHELRSTGLVTHNGDGYRLTNHGQELFELLESMGEWAKSWASGAQFEPG